MMKRVAALFTALLMLLGGSLFTVASAQTLTAEIGFYHSLIKSDASAAAAEVKQAEALAETAEETTPVAESEEAVEEQPAEEPAEDPAEKPEEPVEDPTEEPAEKPEEPVEDPTEEPAEEPVEEPAEPETVLTEDYVRVAGGTKLYNNANLTDCYGTLKKSAVAIRVYQSANSVSIVLNDGSAFRVLWVSVGAISALSAEDCVEYAARSGRHYHGSVLGTCKIALWEEPEETEELPEETEQPEQLPVELETAVLPVEEVSEETVSEETEAVETAEQPEEAAEETKPAEEAEAEAPAEEAAEETAEPSEEAEPAEEAEAAEAEEPAEEAEPVEIEVLSEETKPAYDVNAMEVRIHSDARDVMVNGEACTLTAELIGFEGCKKISLQWMVDKGNGWEEIPGANGLTYVFTASEETLSYRWCVAVDFE